MRLRSQRAALVMAALGLASGGLVACSLLTGLDADYSSSSRDGASAPSSEVGGGDALGPDGGMDGSTNDGMVLSDGDAGARSFCQVAQGSIPAQDVFCTDFEEPSSTGVPPTTPWTLSINNFDAGKLALLDDAGVDASRGLDVSGTSNGAAGAHTLVKYIFGTGGAANSYLHYDFSFDFRLFNSNLNYEALGLLVFAPNTSSGENGISGYGPGDPHELSHQGGVPLVKFVKSYAGTSIWRHAMVILERAAAATAYTRTISIDGMDVDDDLGTHTIAAGAPTEVWLGVFNADKTAGMAHVQFDNVVVRRR
jgi:hypothetical protein